MRENLITAAIITALVVSGSGLSCDDGSHQDFLRWAQQNATPLSTVEPTESLSDLDFLQETIGEARVVCLGESRHDAREQFLLKHRLIKYMVTELGFTTIAFEEGLPYAEQINQYVLHGFGDPEVLLYNMGAWFIWDTHEVLDLIKWMREYNSDQTTRARVRFAGIDITDPAPGIRLVLDCIESLDPEFTSGWSATTDTSIYRVPTWEHIVGNYAAMESAQIAELGSRLCQLEKRVESLRSSIPNDITSAQYDWVLWNAKCLRKSHDLFYFISRQQIDSAGKVRETSMADNVIRHLQTGGDSARIIVWAHNFHVATDTLDLDIPHGPEEADQIPMGKYLKDRLGEKVVSIGMSFYDDTSDDGPCSSAQKGSLDAALAEVDSDLFILDLRNAPDTGQVHNWLSAKTRMRGQGGSAALVPLRAFDILAFTRHVTRTSRSESSSARFNSMH